MTLKSDAKFEKQLTCDLENDMRIWQIFTRALKASKLGFSCDPLIQSSKSMSLNLTEELCVLTMWNDTQFEEELTCCLKSGMRNLTKFDPST